jgi:hypothetical protein
MGLIALALRLGKTIQEIEEISLSEYNEWVAYFGILEGRDENGSGPNTNNRSRHPAR